MKIIKSSSLLFSALILSNSMAWAGSYPKDIKVFTQLAKADEIVDMARHDLPGVDIEVFFVDRYQDIMDSINSKLPFEQLKSMTEDERLAWAKENIHETAELKTLRNMKSKLGVAYTRLFDIQRVPAVLLDDYYLTYGMTISESISAYTRTVDVE